MQKGQKISGRLFISRSNATTPLDLVKKTLYPIANSVKLLVVSFPHLSPWMGRNHRFHAVVFDSLSYPVRIVTGVANKGMSFGVLKKR
jgi:hypothetical protein